MKATKQTKAELVSANAELIDAIGINVYFTAQDLIAARKRAAKAPFLLSEVLGEVRGLRFAQQTQTLTLRHLRKTQPELFTAVVEAARTYFQRDRARKARQAAQPEPIAA